MSPLEIIKEASLSAAHHPWIIAVAFMFQGGVFTSLILGALWLGDINRLVLRNAKDIAHHVTDKPHANAEARLRVLETAIIDTKLRTEVLAKSIHAELIGIRAEIRNSTGYRP